MSLNEDPKNNSSSSQRSNNSNNQNNNNSNNNKLNNTSHNQGNKSNWSLLTSGHNSQTSNFDSRQKSSFFRKKTWASFGLTKEQTRLYKVEFGEENPRWVTNLKYKNNIITTTKYNVITLIPKNLFYQFLRASNIYFLVVSIWTCWSFSPKEPMSMIGTFIFVLFFTMCKDGLEDWGRYKQDTLSNNKWVQKWESGKFVQDLCYKLHPGDIVKISREEEFTCDVLILKSSNDGGYLYIDTKNWDGETNWKEKGALDDWKDFSFTAEEIPKIVGLVETTESDSNWNEWEGIWTYQNITDIYCSIKNWCLKGCVLKNTEYVYGVVIYAGHDTKIMKNSRKPKPKTSKIINTMNRWLYSLFAFTLGLCIVFAGLSVNFVNARGEYYDYIYWKYDPGDRKNSAVSRFFRDFVIFFICYAQIIPISLYVVMEMIKMYQGILISYDAKIYDLELQKPAKCRATELIEEWGQIDFIFSDKTGTLTQNIMVFKKCYINGKVFGVPKQDASAETWNKKNTINGDVSAYETIKSTPTNKKDKDHRSRVVNFFYLLAMCHEVFPEVTPEGIIYQGASPDDIALVKGTQQWGIEFHSKDFSTLKIKDNINNEILNVDVWAVWPFNSDRKRMSIIIKNKITNKIMLYSKGSDGIMLQGVGQIKPIISKYSSKQEYENALKVLDSFSKEGLRIWVMGYKEWDQKTFAAWLRKHDDARTRSEENWRQVYNQIEKDLIFAGCTAIEDKLQEGVPETIAALMSCGIRIWVWTGDKQDTAEQIGRQCRLIKPNMTLINLSCESGNKVELTEKLNTWLDQYGLTRFLFESKKLRPLNKILEAINFDHHFTDCSLIINGVTWEEVLMDRSLRRKFFLLSAICQSVICCRVSPKQKSLVVKLAKVNGDYVTLSIGDGANDVPMIMEASIGVGIQGKEGTQAVRSADYAIGQFRFLETLICSYGRNGYIKISKFICYYFYKNIVLVITELIFAFYDGFSGQIFFADYYGTMFNAIFTSWPCLFTFAYEREHDEETCKIFPVLYRAGPKNKLFNMKVFWSYIIYGLIHSILCFYFAASGWQGNVDQDGKTMNHWLWSTNSFSLVIHVVSLKWMIISDFWNVLTITFTLWSVFVYYLVLVCWCTFKWGSIFQNEIIGASGFVWGNLKSMIIILIAPFLICLPDIALKQIYFNCFPTPSEYITKYKTSASYIKYLSLAKTAQNQSNKINCSSSLQNNGWQSSYHQSNDNITNLKQKWKWSNKNNIKDYDRDYDWGNTTNVPLKEYNQVRLLEGITKHSNEAHLIDPKTEHTLKVLENPKNIQPWISYMEVNKGSEDNVWDENWNGIQDREKKNCLHEVWKQKHSMESISKTDTRNNVVYDSKLNGRSSGQVIKNEETKV